MVEILAGDAAAVRVNVYVAQQSCLAVRGQCSVLITCFSLAGFVWLPRGKVTLR